MQHILKRLNFRNSLVVQGLGLSAFTAGGLGSIPGKGTKDSTSSRVRLKGGKKVEF